MQKRSDAISEMTPLQQSQNACSGGYCAHLEGPCCWIEQDAHHITLFVCQHMLLVFIVPMLHGTLPCSQRIVIMPKDVSDTLLCELPSVEVQAQQQLSLVLTAAASKIFSCQAGHSGRESSCRQHMHGIFQELRVLTSHCSLPCPRRPRLPMTA